MTRTPDSVSVVSEAARTPIDGSASTVEPVGAGLDEEQHGRAVEAGSDDEQLGVGASRHHRLHAVEDEPVIGPA